MIPPKYWICIYLHEHNRTTQTNLKKNLAIHTITRQKSLTSFVDHTKWRLGSRSCTPVHWLSGWVAAPISRAVKHIHSYSHTILPSFRSGRSPIEQMKIHIHSFRPQVVVTSLEAVYVLAPKLRNLWATSSLWDRTPSVANKKGQDKACQGNIGNLWLIYGYIIYG